MKRFLLITIMFVFTILSNAQNEDSLIVIDSVIASDKDSLKTLYLEFGGGPCSSDGGFYQFSITFSVRKNWVGSISFYLFKLIPDNLPDDFKPGHEFSGIAFGKKVNWPKRNIGALNFTAGKKFSLVKNVFATMQTGLSIGGGEEISYKSQTVTGTSSNYSITKKSTGLIGGLLKADLNFAFASWLGLGFGCIYSFNSIQSAIGPEFKLLLGKMK